MVSTANAELKANASLSLAPTKSQGFLALGLIVVSLTVAASCGMFYIKDPIAGYAFLVFGSIFSGGLFYCWHRSQRDADLDGARATQIKTVAGLTISTDSRVLNHPNGVEGLARLLEAVQRQPLPPANGLVVNGKIVADSEQAAREQTAKINAQSQAAVNAALDGLGLSTADCGASQDQLLTVPPPMHATGVADANSAVA